MNVNNMLPIGSEAASGRGAVTPEAWAAHIRMWHERAERELRLLETKLDRTPDEQLRLHQLRNDVREGREAMSAATKRAESFAASTRRMSGR